MIKRRRHLERHRSHHIGWLRAAVLGANDGIVSTASLLVGVAAAHSPTQSLLLTGTAGLVSGAMAMAAGEYVSVSSQADTEGADLARERAELDADSEHEHQELAEIYMERGLDAVLARQVSDQLMAHDALGSHARDELGIFEQTRARPIQAALASALTFAVGASLPMAAVLLAPEAWIAPAVAGFSWICLVALGILAARTGGANIWKGAARVGLWGALAMAATAGIGHLFGAVV